MAIIDVLVGTTLGGAEYVSDELIAQLEVQGHQTRQHLEPNLADIPYSDLWLLVCSTHGAGELPDNIQPFHQQLLEQQPDLSKVKFAVCAIGDTSYDTFCQGPEVIIDAFKTLGASEFTTKIQIDVQQDELPEDSAQLWLESWLPLL